MTRRVVLFDTQYLPASETTLYEAPSNTITTIDKFVCYNADTGASHVVTALVVPPGETPTGTEFIVEKKTLQPKQTWLFQGVVGNMIVEGGALQAFADAPDVVVARACGREDSVD